MGLIHRVAVFTLLCVGAAAEAGRAPVLPQIDLPHPYYFRELYLPQLTSGPSSLAWMPDGNALVFAMAGSLWRTDTQGDTAQQLTWDQSYDYQPDVSPDGRWVVYSAYLGSAIELKVLDLASGESRFLTHNGAVNVEPRFSPDGARVAFVSSTYHGHFHVFVSSFDPLRDLDAYRVTGENRSELPRYYYSSFDHEISPLWTRDGRGLIYVSNRNHIYGTGGFWQQSLAQGAPPPIELHYEETNWKARPDLSADGSRLVYGSYLGRAWHNLWVMPAVGGDAFPIGYGDYDQINPRFSPDGARIAFISNQHGNTEIVIQAFPGAAPRALPLVQRRYLKPMAHLKIVLTADADGISDARVSITDTAGRFYAPADALVHADDGFDAKQRAFEAHYFHLHGTTDLDVPAGALSVEILHGFERKFERRQLTLAPATSSQLTIDLKQNTWAVPNPGHWVSGDAHVHMNYGGTYHNTPALLVRQARAENVSMINSLLVNKEQRFPDFAYNGISLDPASLEGTWVIHGQEYHTSYWGHLGLLGLQDGLILPGYVGYPNTAAASLYPMNADIADIAHARGALVGYVHPFDEYPQPESKPKDVLTSELPVDVALGKVDYMEILGFSDHRATAAVWYQLLNLGFRIPAAGGTDAMANYASLRGPVGMNRVYVNVPEAQHSPQAWYAGLKQGRTFATNGPLLGLSMNGAQIGDELHLKSGAAEVEFAVRLRSIVPVEQLDLVCNGRVIKSLLRAPRDQADFLGRVRLRKSGWCIARASTAGGAYPILDNYAYATTSPIYVTIDDAPPRSPTDARYFVAWIDRVMATTAAYPDWSSEAEQNKVLERLATARARFLALQ